MKCLTAALRGGVIALVLLLATSAVSAQSTTTLGIAYIGQTEGRQAEADRLAYQAAALAAEQINAGEDDDIPGITGPRSARYNLEVVFYEANTPAEALDAYTSAVNNGVSAVLGPQDARLLAGITDSGTPAVPVISAAPDASASRSRVFRAAASLDDWAKAAADYLVNARQFTRIALVTADTTAATRAASLFRSAAGSGLIAADLINAAGEEFFDDDARVIQQARAQAVFVWMPDAQTIALLAALRAAGWSGPVLYAGLSADFISRAGDLAVGVVGLAGWSPAAYDAVSEAFVADYAARWGAAPADSSAAYYDAVYLLADAISRAGSTASTIATRLGSSTTFSGVQGAYKGAQTDALLIVQVGADGQVVEAARYGGGDCATCLNTVWADTSATSASATATFNIGLIANLTGPSQAAGRDMEQAARLAVREINSAGGVVRNRTRYTLNLQVYDAAANGAAAAFEQAVAGGMQVVLGPDYNAQVLPNLSAASSSGLIQLVSATSAQIALTDSDDAVLQTRATDTAQVEAAAAYLLDVRGLERFAFVAVQADYGLDAADAFAAAITASDSGELALRLEHAITGADYAALAGQIAAANIEAVAAWTTEPAALALLEALNAAGWNGVFVYGYLTPQVAAQITASTVEIIGPVSWWNTARAWGGQDFAARYSARFGADPLLQSAAYYDAVYLIASAVQSAGATPGNIQRWLTRLDSFEGVQGSYRPSDYSTGELTRALIMVRVDGSGVQEIARYDGTTCLSGCVE